MENASKALLIAGGILLTMLVIGVLFFARSRVSEFYDEQDEFKEVEDIAKFNVQFTNYQNRDVYGYEIISLANKIIDYNYRFSNASGAQNDQKYNKIEMEIDLGDKYKIQFKFRETQDIPALFPNQKYSSIDQIKIVIDQASNIENTFGDSKTASSLAKSINTLFPQDASGEEYQTTAVNKYNSIVGKNEVKEYSELNKKKSSIFKYYEFYQFKKSKYSCPENAISFDNTGRVNKISFKFESLS